MLKEPALEITNLNVREVIKDFSLTVYKGEKIIITGPNGCGKTTLLKTILGIIKPASGTVNIPGNKKGFLAYCGQEKENNTFPISVEEVLSLSSPEKAQIVEKAARSTSVLPLMKRNFFSLSGGEKQRVSIARCLCQNPGIILLDEPFTFLDKDGVRDLTNLLKDLEKTEITILLVTHQGAETLLSDSWRVLEL